MKLFSVILEPIQVGQAAKDYLNLYVNPTLLAGLTALCKHKPADPLVGTVSYSLLAWYSSMFILWCLMVFLAKFLFWYD